MAWNDTFASGYRWGSVANFGMFVDAIRERGATLPAIAAGDVVQRRRTTAPSGSPGDPTYAFSIHYLQKWCEDNVGSWTATMRHNGAAYVAATFDNTINEPQTWSLVSTTGGGTHPNIQDAALGGHSWTRKYPREYSAPASTVYTDGASFANGHKARNIAEGKVYTRTAGAWVLAAAGTAPDKVTAYGKQEVGDYIGYWLFNELRDVINLFLWKVRAFFSTTREYLSASGSGATPAAGRAAADTDWLTANTGAFSPFTSTRVTIVDEDGDTNIWVRREKFVTSASSTVASSVDFYIGATVQNVASATSDIFDAQGSDVIEDKFSLFDTQANAAAGTVTSGWTALLTQPTWAADPTVPGDRNSLGWVRNIPPGATLSGFAVERFTGFTYKP